LSYRKKRWRQSASICFGHSVTTLFWFRWPWACSIRSGNFY